MGVEGPATGPQPTSKGIGRSHRDVPSTGTRQRLRRRAFGRETQPPRPLARAPALAGRYLSAATETRCSSSTIARGKVRRLARQHTCSERFGRGHRGVQPRSKGIPLHQTTIGGAQSCFQQRPSQFASQQHPGQSRSSLRAPPPFRAPFRPTCRLPVPSLGTTGTGRSPRAVRRGYAPVLQLPGSQPQREAPLSTQQPRDKIGGWGGCHRTSYTFRTSSP